MTINEDRLWRTDQQIRHTVCHELAHTVGSDDGDTRSDGCFPTSGHSTDIFWNTHEINHINARW